MQRIKFIEGNDKKEIIIPSSKNWFFIIVFFVAILVWLVVELIIVPALIIANLDHFLSFAPWLVGWTAIGLFIIKIWVWEAFGNTILFIRENELVIKKKFDFFSATKYFKLSGITDLKILNEDIEITKNYICLNSLFSSNTKTIAFNFGFLKVKVVKWINQKEAEQIIAVLSKSIESSKSQEN